MTSQATYDALSGLIGENSERQDVNMWLDTGVAELNEAISGSVDLGMPVGRLIEIFGPPSCGKTFLSTMVMAACQQAGGIAGFSDHERSFKADLAQSLGLNVDASKGNWFYQRPQTFEESVDKAVAFCEAVRRKSLIPEEAPLVWVFDSVASMIPHEKLYDAKGNRRGVGDYNMRDSLLLAKCTSQSYPMLAQFAEDNNMLVLLLNQIRMKPGVMFGDPTTTPGGNAAEFYCSSRISLGKKEINNGKSGAEKKILGNKVKAKLVKNKISRPFETAEWRVLFQGHGAMVDEAGTVLDYLDRKGLINKSGNGRFDIGGKNYTFNQVVAACAAEPKLLDKLKAMAREEDAE